jgi:hypothetical protein
MDSTYYPAFVVQLAKLIYTNCYINAWKIFILYIYWEQGKCFVIPKPLMFLRRSQCCLCIRIESYNFIRLFSELVTRYPQ